MDDASHISSIIGHLRGGGVLGQTKADLLEREVATIEAVRKDVPGALYDILGVLPNARQVEYRDDAGRVAVASVATSVDVGSLNVGRKWCEFRDGELVAAVR